MVLTLTLKIKKYLQNLFKKFSYSIFHLIYGKVMATQNSTKENSNIQKNIVNMGENRKYIVCKLTETRLYTDRIHSAAAIKNNFLIKDASFQIEDKTFLNNDNIVLKIGTPRLLKKIKGKVLSLLAGGGGNHNYWHWLFDVLPRIELYKQTFRVEDLDYLLVPSYSESFQKETLDLLNFEKEKILSSLNYRHILPTELYVTQHPYRIKDFDKDELNIPIWIIKWLRLKFLEHSKISKINLPKKIYIDRGDSRYETRKIINDSEVKKFLEKKGFAILRLADYSFIDQIKLFSSAKYVVGLHGGGFANIIFCNQGTNLLELRTKKTGKIIQNLAIKNNLNFNTIELDQQNIGAKDQQGHVNVDLKELEKKLIN